MTNFEKAMEFAAMMNDTNSHYTFGSNPKHYTCCICGEEFHDYGNNPQPISQKLKDRCCNKCNHDKVLPERHRRYLAGLSMYL